MKKASKERKPTSLRAFLLTLVAVVALLIGGITFATADAGDVPAHGKGLTPNDDGTYELELSVTGDADTTAETAANVNVLVVIDTSSSMTRYRANGGYSGPYRADAAEKVAYDFAHALFGYQDSSNPTNIQMALMTFDHSARMIQNWTSTESQITSNLSATGNMNSRRLTYNQGTNWEAAMRLALANNVLGAADGDPTFVIFVTDGAPSQVANTPAGTYLDASQAFGPSQDEARSIQIYDTTTHTSDADSSNTTLYGIYAYGDEADYLDDVIYYAVNGTKRASETAATVATDQYYNATDTDQLEAAIEEIFQEIVETLGVSAVSIEDGTTSEVATSTGDIAELLEVDDTSFEYWLSIPVTGSGPYAFSRTNPTTGEVTNYTVTVSGDTCTVTGGASPITVTGSVSRGQFKFKWEGATELSNGKTPPAATFDGSSVDWDLSSAGTLLDGVTYSVTFDVYPSQYTYDTIARIDNGDIQYSSLPAEVRQYLNENGTLRTNTAATLSYTDTRTDDGPQTSFYVNPDPVGLEAATMSVHKGWENALDARSVGQIGMTVLMDGAEFTDVTLSDPQWSQDNIYISTGLMRTRADGTMQVLDTGHDFTFAELGTEQFNWELVSPVVHPMLIDGELTMLVLDDDNFPNEDLPQVHIDGLEDTYTLNGKTYYVAGSGSASLEAYNYRRSNLNLTKVVTGEDAPDDAEFPFTLTVTNSKADDPTSTDTNSDNFVWFSIYDTVAGATVMDATVTAEGLVGPSSSGYYYVRSGTAITVNMQAGWNLRFTNLPTGTTYTFVEGDVDDGFAFNKSELTGQYGSEAPQSGTAADSSWTAGQTSSGTIQSTNTTYQVTFTNDYELTDLEITKAWVDNSNQDGIRPTADEFAELLTLSPEVEGATPTVAVDPDDSNSYIITYTGLPRFVDGQEVTYTVAEDDIEGYTTEGSPAKDHGTITNTHEPDVTDISVTKVWDDANDQDGIRPTSVQVQLYADGEAAGPVVTLNEGNEWAYTWEDLPVNASGTAIVYTVTEVETDVITGTDGPGTYAYAVTGDAEVGFTVTNTHTPEQTTVSVTKVWSDAENQDGIRPDSVQVQLQAEGTASGDPVTLDEAGNWTYTFTNLPKYANGTEIAYTVTEVETAVITGTDGPGTYAYAVTGSASAGFTVTNTHTPETVEATVTKVWDDANDQDGKRPESLTVTLSDGQTVTLSEANQWTATITGLPKYANGQEITYTWTEGDLPEGYELTDTSVVGTVTTLTNSYEPEEITVTVIKAWDDASNQDGKRPDELALTLKADGTEVTGVTPTIAKSGDSWTYTWSGLPKYKDGGTEIAYTVTEAEVPDGYTCETTTVDAGGTITNRYTPEQTTVTVTKAWADASNQDGIRPDTLTLTLNGLPDGVEAPEPTITKSGDSWTYTWSGLPKFSGGTEIAYTVTEAEVPDGYTCETTTVGAGGTITNTHTPETVVVTVTKAWNDVENQDGKRPESITVRLLADGTEVDSATITETDGRWTHTFRDLPKYKDGQLIEYSVTEDEVGEYVTTIDPSGAITIYVDGEGNVTVTNTHEPEQTTVSVAKVWEDANDQDGIRPDSVQVQLLANGEDYGAPVTLNEGNEWAYTWADLDVYASGEEIEYTVEEVETDVITGTDGVGTYAYEVTGDATEGYTVTNTHTPETVEVPVAKVWSDADDQDGIRPDSVTVELYADGAATGKTVTLSEDNDWSDTWADLPKYKDGGTEIAYTVVEAPVPTGYSANTTGSASAGYTITNTHTPSETTVSVAKAWEDEGDQDGCRPDSVQVQLYADGTATGDPVTLDASNNWTYTWTGIPEKSAGQAITYTVQELTDEVVTGTDGPGTYAIAVTGDAATGFTVTNTHTPEETTYTATKVWSDADNQDGIRPTSVTVELYADGVATGMTATLDASNNWTHTWEELIKYKEGEQGVEVVYSVVETSVPAGYGVTYDGTSVINTHKPYEVEVTVTKEWDDAENQDGIRPESVQVQLYADGTAVGEAVTLDESNDWTHTWVELPKNNAGTEIVYTVEEVEVPDGYDDETSGDPITADTEPDSTPGADGALIVNVHEPELIVVNVSKEWDDFDNQDGVRPSSIEVVLKADGEEYARGTLSADDWSYTFTDLPKFKPGEVGQEVVYTIAEVTVDDYEVEMGEVTATDDGYAVSITNSHELIRTEVSVEKVWDDADDQDGIRPDSVQVQLYADGEPYGDPVTLDDSNDWSYTWEELIKYAEGEVGREIDYTVEEVEVPEDYEATVSETDGGYIITNSHTPYETDITVNKVWDDDNDATGVRPETVTVTLLANGEEVTSVSIYASAGWTYTFTGLPVNKGGEKIEYTVVESVPYGYTATYSGDAESGLTITNTCKPVMIDPPVEKVVKGSPSEDATFTFQMVAKTDGAPMPEGATDGVMTIQITGSGSREFGEIYFYEPGTYVYEITEVNTGIDGYTYDTAVYTLTVEVTANEDGSLSKTEIVTDGSGNKVDHIVFTNTYEKKPGPKPKPDPDIPQTGDPTNALPAALLAVIGGGCAIAGVVLRRRKED